MTRSTVKILLKYACGLAILASVIYLNWTKVDENGHVVPGLSIVVQKQPNYGYLALGLAVCTFGVAITFIRWYVLVVAQDLPVYPRDVLRLSLLGFFFNTFLPGSVGGDLVKSAFLVREQSRQTLAVATVALDRIIGLAGLFWLVALLGGSLYVSGVYDSLLTDESAGRTIQIILVFSAAIVGGTLAAWLIVGWISGPWLDRLQDRLDARSKIGHSLAELVRAVRVYREKGGSVALALAMSMVGHFCFVLSFYYGALLYNDADEIPSFLTHLMIVPMGMVIRGVIPLPGGIGGAELAYGKLYVWVGKTFDAGVLGSMGELAFKVIMGFAALVIYQIMDKKRATPDGLATKS